MNNNRILLIAVLLVDVAKLDHAVIVYRLQPFVSGIVVSQHALRPA